MAGKDTSPTRYAVLGLIARGPQTGYSIKQYFERPEINFWNESYGQIYPQLRALAELGFLECEKKAAGNGKPKKIYTITEDGKEALARWLRRPSDMTQTIRDEPKLRFLIGAMVDPVMTRTLLEKMLDETRSHQALLEDSKDTPRELSEQLLFERACDVNALEMTWLEDAIERLSGET